MQLRLTPRLRVLAAHALVRTSLVVVALTGLSQVECVSAAARAEPAPAPARTEHELNAAQIVERHITARGGLVSWQRIETMTWFGRIENTSPQVPVVPFLLQTKHPGKTRFELRTDEFKSVRTYDGDHGWVLRQSRLGRPDVRAFAGDEMRYVKDAPGFAGVLIEHIAERLAIALEGIEPVDGRSAYRLAVTLPSGARHHVWIDMQTFLDIKYDRAWHGQGGQEGTVAVYNRAFSSVDGLQVPARIEIGGAPGKAPERMTIEKVMINPPLEDRIFAMPRGFEQRREVMVDMRAKSAGDRP
jgi:hypothetical protein